MRRIIAAVILILSTTLDSVHANWFNGEISRYALDGLIVSEFKEKNGNVWGIVYGGPLKPAQCRRLDYKKSVPCLVEFNGRTRTLDLVTAYPGCISDYRNIPEAVRLRCEELNPFAVVSTISGSRDMYDIDSILAWHTGKRVGTIPMNKIGKVANGTVCEPHIVLMVGGDIVGISTNTDGVRGSVRCK